MRALGLGLIEIITAALILLVVLTVIANLLSGGIHNDLNAKHHRKSSVPIVKKPSTRM